MDRLVLSGRPSQEDRRTVRILLIEDSLDDAIAVKRSLSKADAPRFVLQTAGSWGEAQMELAAEPLPQVILLDLHLPDAEGTELVEAVVRAAPRVPVVVLTGAQRDTLALDVLSLGAQDYLVKGAIGTDALCRSIRYAIERHRIEEARRTSDERYRHIVETASDIIYEADARGRFVFVNSQTERLSEYRGAEIVGRHALWFVHPAWRSRLTQAYRRHFSEGDSGMYYEFPIRTRSGGLVWIGQSLQWVRSGDRIVAYRAVARDISERKRLDAMKDEFISIMNHELRTPITAILGALGLARSGAVEELSDGLRELIDLSHANAGRLANIVDDILDLERMRSGAGTFRAETTELLPIVEEAVAENQSYASRLGVEIVLCDVPAEELLVRVDPKRIAQVLANLLSNASKFSPREGRVLVSVEPRGESVRVSVRDSGPGVPEHFRDRIFGRFAQADSSDSREKGGTGLGLSICKEIMDRLGGEVGYANHPDGGATFYFDLPLQRDAKVEGT